MPALTHLPPTLFLLLLLGLTALYFVFLLYHRSRHGG